MKSIREQKACVPSWVTEKNIFLIDDGTGEPSEVVEINMSNFMKSIREQREDEKVEELAQYMFNDDRTWRLMSEVTREDWRRKAKHLLKGYKVERKKIN